MDGRRISKEDGSESNNPFFQTPPPPAISPYYQTHVPANTSTYQQPPPGWNPFMYGLQSHPPGWFPPGMQQPNPHAAMYPPAQYPAMVSATEGMPQPSVGDEDDVEVLPIPPAGSLPSSEQRRRTKLSNFNPTEDTNLVKACLEISCDPVIGNGQRQDGFWKRVGERYDFRRGHNPQRSLRSLSSRWSTIKAQCANFAGRFAEAIRENPSGMSDADKTSWAAANFADLEGHAFQFMHCWDLLKDEPKWRDPPEPEGEGFEDDGSDDSNRVATNGDKSAGKRPMGRDKAKAKSKRSKTVSGDGEYATRLQDLSIQKISIMQ
ncbi:hypothetical protein U9M48_025167 [Paspalum notatum var. saurae]|uniref:No apical meristem-associated C-terminal domain-containing protein n=1 Tax=Paspalum notatum var. saurae TaxID=547442 RepID=A0AAQ3TUD6_PASNO